MHEAMLAASSVEVPCEQMMPAHIAHTIVHFEVSTGELLPYAAATAMSRSRIWERFWVATAVMGRPRC